MNSFLCTIPSTIRKFSNVKGNVTIAAKPGAKLDIPDGTLLENKVKQHVY